MSTRRRVRKKDATVKQQLMAAVSMFLIALISLTAATYAWFTYVSNPEITNIDMKVSTADELYLSPYHSLYMDPQDPSYATQTYTDPFYDPSLWFGTITQPMLESTTDVSIPSAFKQVSGFPDPNAGMKNVSSVFTVLNRNFFNRTLDAKGLPIAYVSAGISPKAGGYVSFDLWIKSSKSGLVYLDSPMNNWVKAIDMLGDTNNTFDSTDLKKKFIENTVRVGFYTAGENYDGSGNAKVVIWEPNSATHLPSTYGGTAADGTSDTTLAITTASPISAPELATEGGKTAQKTYDFGAAGSKGSNITGDDQKIGLFYLDADRAVKFTVAIWVEGADSDTLNAVAGSFFRTYLTLGQDASLTMLP